MATFHQHLQQWRHNRRFLETISSSYSDWMITVCFYTALHAVDALLAYDKVTGITSHDSRNHMLMRTTRYQQINRHYKPLYMLSRTIRYLADPQGWVPYEQIDARVVVGYLYPIEVSVQKLTGEHLDLVPVSLLPAS